MNDVSKTPRLRGKHVVVIGDSRGLAVCRREVSTHRYEAAICLTLMDRACGKQWVKNTTDIL